MKSRLERMYALAPRDINAGQDTCLSVVNREKARDTAISPPTAAKLRAFEEPTKAAVTDYDRAMTSAEASIRKAMNVLEKTVKEQKAEQEKREAHAVKIAQLRQKKKDALEVVLDKARQAGENEAEVDAGEEGIDSSEEEEEGVAATEVYKVAQTLDVLEGGLCPLGTKGAAIGKCNEDTQGPGAEHRAGVVKEVDEAGAAKMWSETPSKNDVRQLATHTAGTTILEGLPVLAEYLHGVNRMKDAKRLG